MKKKVQFGMRIDEGLKQAIINKSKKDNRSESNTVETILKEYFKLK